MRIAHIVRTMDPRAGGPPEGIKSIATAVTRLGHEVTIVTFDAATDPWLKELKTNIVALGPSWLIYGLNFKIIKWLRKHSKNFDVFILNGIWQFHTFACWYVLAKTSAKYIVYPHGMLDPWFQENNLLKAIKKSLYWRIIEGKVIRDAAFVAFTSNDEMFNARTSFRPYVANEKCVGYGIPDPLKTFPKKTNKSVGKIEVPEKEKIILFLSRIHPKKGCDLLIKGFNRFLNDQGPNTKNYRLIIAGPCSESYIKEIKTIIGSIENSNSVTIMDMVVGADKWALLDNADVFCLPSHQENFGIVVAEALSRGCPVLISDRVNIHSDISQFNAGLVDSDSEDGVYRMLVKWFSLSLEDQIQIRMNARNCFESKFQIDFVVKTILSQLEELKITV